MASAEAPQRVNPCLFLQAALLSCLVFTEKGGDTAKAALREELAGPHRRLQDAARRVGSVLQESKLDIDVEEYVRSFRSDMMEVVFAWVNGAKFVDICSMTKVHSTLTWCTAVAGVSLLIFGFAVVTSGL